MLASRSAERWRSGNRGVRGGGQPVGRHHEARAPVGQPVFRRDQADDALQALGRAGDFGQLPVLELAFDQQQLGVGVIEDIGRAVGAVVEIERHRHQPQRQRGLIEDHPLDAVLQHHRDAVAGNQAFLRQRRLPARHLGRHLRPR
jgi:hypothetical protein